LFLGREKGKKGGKKVALLSSTVQIGKRNSGLVIFWLKREEKGEERKGKTILFFFRLPGRKGWSFGGGKEKRGKRDSTRNTILFVKGGCRAYFWEERKGTFQAAR